MRRLITLLFSSILLLNSYNSHAIPFPYRDGMHFPDTLRTPAKVEFFQQILDFAPRTFEYDKIIRSNKRIVMTGIHFNNSMKNVLESKEIKADPKLEGKIRKLYKSIKTFSPAFDLILTYKDIPEGVAVDYEIQNIRLFVSSKKKK